MVRMLNYILHILTDVWCIIIGARRIFTPTHIYWSRPLVLAARSFLLCHLC